MLDFLTTLCGGGNKKAATTADKESEVEPFSFPDQGENLADDTYNYNYPNLFEEADEMLVVAMLMYAITDLRTLAKAKKSELRDPDRILDFPVKLDAVMAMIEENLESIKDEFADHEMTMAALQSIQARYQQDNGSMSNILGKQNNDKTMEPAFLTAFGDYNPDKELVYGVGVDPARKRVTVAFRGSVTPADFFTDACIAFNKRDNPLKDEPDQEEMIGLHHGFDEYLLKRRKDIKGGCKYDEIMNHVKTLFEDQGRKEKYKLYVTGHSLGGALASLFAFEAAALESGIPKPVTCVSVASPRVGDLAFQKAFRHLEETGLLRHLRIAHAQDPVTMMPKSSSKKIFAMLSPISYIAFKAQDANFAGRETYRHTGLKLRLEGDDEKEDASYQLSYSGITTAQEELGDDDEVKNKGDDKTKGSSSLLSSIAKLSMKDVPGIKFHYCTTYTGQLAKVKEELSGKTLNELYLTMAPGAGKVASS